MRGDAVGRISDARANVVHAHLPGAAVGELVEIHRRRGTATIHGTVRKINDGTARIAPHGEIEGVCRGDEVRVLSTGFLAPVGLHALGRAIDARGRVIDGGDDMTARRKTIAFLRPSPAQRVIPTAPLWTGIKTVDALLTIARGGRVGIFGVAGSGKSSLLAAMERGSVVDASVVALIGERGREAREWLARLHPRMTIVCASSDRSAAERVAAATMAIAQANQLRELGLDVLLILDSLARLAAAIREVAVACGEPVGRGGFPASVCAELARFVEAAGATSVGSITLAATVLSDENSDRDTVAEIARSLLDGHITLSLAHVHAGRYPAIDVSLSASRLMHGVIERDHANDAAIVRRAICALKDSMDARSLGLPQANPQVRAAQRCEAEIEEFQRQEVEPVPAARTWRDLHALAERLLL